MMNFIDQYDEKKIGDLAGHLREAKEKHADASWPAAQMELFAQAGVYRWFVPSEQGGVGWSADQIAAAYVDLAAACLSSTFILTQRIAALRRIAASPNRVLQQELLPQMLNGERIATVGISHLTTSRQHVDPVMKASLVDNEWVLDGFCPWVTGANGADELVVGAQLEDGQQVLAIVPTDHPGIEIKPGFEMIALTDTHTGAVHLDSVPVANSQIIAGPVENVLSSLQTGASTGSVQTSSLALGLAQAAIKFLDSEATQRDDLRSSAAALTARHDQLKSMLLQAAAGNPVCTNEELRTDANQLVLRATQAAMVAAKGAGFLATHPVGRWCREAMFFLVWSCPQAVRDANLCDFAGVEIR